MKENMQLNKEPRYIDADGIALCKKEIEALEIKKAEILGWRCEGSSLNCGNDYDIDNSYLNKHEESYRIQDMINHYKQVLSEYVVIEKHGNADLVDIDDIVVLHYLDESNGDKTYKLVAHFPEDNPEIRETSINSPIGKAIYGKCVGEVIDYETRKGTFKAVVADIIKKELSR